MRLMALGMVLWVLGVVPATGNAQGSVWVVDDFGGPGTDFTDLQAAIVAAADGDVILVRTGQYSPTSIAGKSLFIQADTGAVVELAGLVIGPLTSGQSVVVDGVICQTGPFQTSSSMTVVDCQGPVLLQDCHALSPQTAGVGDGVGLNVSNSLSVTCIRGSFSGGTVSATLSGAGIESVQSTLHLSDCAVMGGPGFNAAFGLSAGGPGGAGVSMTDTRLFASGGSIHGGPGGQGGLIGCTDGGPGGAGVLDAGGPSEIVLREVSPVGGAGGAASGSCSSGTAGLDLDLTAAVVQQLAVSARYFTSTTPARVGQAATIELDGRPLDRAWFVWSLEPGLAAFQPSFSGAFLGAAPFRFVFLGSLSPAGSLDIHGVPPSLGVDFLVLYEQALFWSAGDGLVLGNGQAVVILDGL